MHQKTPLAGPLEIGGSLSAIFSARSQSAAVDQSEICKRNLTVDSILNSNSLCAIDFKGDGNCLSESSLWAYTDMKRIT